MAGQHYAGVNIDRSLAAALVAEKDRLVSSIMRLCLGGGIHAATIQAVSEFLRRFSDAGRIPWVRMYESLPPWQQRCGLLQGNWDRNVVPERAKVIFTLITPLVGGAISRKALGAGGGTWKSTGAEPIGSGEVVLSKLYLKRDDGSRGGFTALEFHLTATADRLQPRVAICVLHPTDYRDCVRDLKECCDVGYFLGGNPPLAPIYQDSDFARPTNGPHVDHLNSQTSYGQSSNHSFEEAPPVPAYLNDLTQNLFSDNSMPESGGEHSDAALTSTLNEFCSLL